MLTRELRNSRERESPERQTAETDRQVADDDVTSESHKSIAQTNRTNEVAQKLLREITGRAGRLRENGKSTD